MRLLSRAGSGLVTMYEPIHPGTRSYRDADRPFTRMEVGAAPGGYYSTLPPVTRKELRGYETA